MDFQKSAGLGVEVHFFDFGVGSHYGGLAPKRESGAQHPGSNAGLERGVHGSLTYVKPSAKESTLINNTSLGIHPSLNEATHTCSQVLSLDEQDEGAVQRFSYF
ncbi:hypothetical protein NLO98_04725 [Pseudomonas syringae]|nr:hypothetical protein [Pseudomonas syringae]